jgi:hypothetical protein
VTHPHRPVGADVVEQADDVCGQLPNVIGLAGLWARRSAVAALIGGQHVIARRGQRRDLVPPRVRQFGEPVRQHHHRRIGFPGLDNPQPHTVGIN